MITGEKIFQIVIYYVKTAFSAAFHNRKYRKYHKRHYSENKIRGKDDAEVKNKKLHIR